MSMDNSQEATGRGKRHLDDVAVLLHATDNVAIVKEALAPGTILTFSGRTIAVQHSTPSAHKVSVQPIEPGEAVRRYGQTIGFATQRIMEGEHVHTHNLTVGDIDHDYDFGADVRPVDLVPAGERRTFMGYRRPDGRTGTRNYIAVMSSVNCSAHATRMIAQHFTPERLFDFPHVDGVIPFVHGHGCSIRPGSIDHTYIQRTLAGIARHPNVATAIFVGLGCEVNQVDEIVEGYALCNHEWLTGRCPTALVIQDLGGTRGTVNAGIEAIERVLPEVNGMKRVETPISELTIALQCGGSDSWSGVTANPALGLASDEIVRQGGTVVLGETTEIYGAEHLLTRRAINREVGEQLLALIHWWEKHTRKHDMVIDNNPTPGNKAGGLTTIFEKSLGAVAKAGSTPLRAVYDYAEPVQERGFVFMNTPGNDWAAAAGQVAGGCTLMVFTTGRGSVYALKPTPCIKVASNSAMYQRMEGDMDVNAGRVLDGLPLETVAQELLDLIVTVASGQQTKSEALGVGEAEFSPWHLGGLV